MAVGVYEVDGKLYCANCKTQLYYVNNVVPSFCFSCGNPFSDVANEFVKQRDKALMVTTANEVLKLLTEFNDIQKVEQYIISLKNQ